MTNVLRRTRPLIRLSDTANRFCPLLGNWFLMQHHLRFTAYEAPLRVVPILCSSRGISLDVGANVGIYSRRMMPFSNEVIAVEPNPDVAEYLRECFGDKITIHQCAAGVTSGPVNLHVPIDKNGRRVSGLGSIVPSVADKFGRTESIAVTVQTLDDIAGDRDVSLIKIDVEGFEISVIESAAGILTRSRPNLIVESQRDHDPSAPHNLFRIMKAKYDYEGFFIVRHSIVPASSYIDKYQTLEHDNSDFVNNFIFLPMEKVSLIMPAMRKELQKWI